MTTPLSSSPSAGLLRRLLALVYDSLLLLGVTFAYGVLVWGLRKALGQDTLSPVSGPQQVVILLGLYLLVAYYYVFCWHKRGQTLGMKSWRLRVQTAHGKLLSLKQCWLRCLLAPISLLAMGLGYLWCLLPGKSCWHDSWTQTKVVVMEKHVQR